MANLRGLFVALFIVAFVAIASAPLIAQTAPADGDAALRTAQQLFNAGKWAEAARAFEDFQIRFPQHPQAVNAPFNIAEALVQLGDFDKARPLLADYVSGEVDQEHKALALFRLGECSFFLNEYDRARKDLELFQSQFPNHDKDSYVIEYLGDIFLDPAAPDGAAAKQLFQKGLDKYKAKKGKDTAQQKEIARITEVCRLGLARAHAALGETPQAISIFKQMAENPTNPLASDARIRLGRLYYDAQRYGEAITALKPFEKAAKSPNRNWGLYWLGRSYLDRADKGDERSATDTFKLMAITNSPDEPPTAAVAYFKGEAARVSGQLDYAIERYELAAYDYPDSEWADDAFLGAMRVALEKQDYRKVTVDYLSTAVQQFSTSPLYPYMDQLVGQAFLKTEKYTDAQSTFAQLTQKYPRGGDPTAPAEEATPPTSFTNDNWLYLALAEIGLSKPEKALAALKRIEPTSGAGSADFAMAVSAAEASANVSLGNYRDAIPALQQYLQVRSNDYDAPRYLELLSQCQIMEKQSPAAQRTIEELRKLDPDEVGGEEVILKIEQRLAVLAAKQKEKELARTLYTWLTFRDNPQVYKDFGEDGLARLDAGKPPVDGENVADSAPISGRAEEQAAFGLFQAGIREEQLGDNEKALGSFVSVYTNYASTPEAPKALLAAGRILDRGQKDAEAAKLLRRLVSEYAQFPQIDLAWYRLGWTLVESGDLNGGQDAFREIVDEYRDSTLWADAAYRVAEFESAVNRRDEANRLLDEILRDSEKTDNPTRLLDHVLYLRAQNALQDQKWTVVESLAAQLLKDTPDSPLKLSAQYLAAEAAYKNRDWEKAHQRFTALARDASGRNESWLPIAPLRLAQIMAWNAKSSADWQDTLEAADDIQRRFPNFDRMHEVDYLMGRCQVQLGNFTAARKHFENVIALDDGNRGEAAAMSQWMIGETYFRQGKMPENYEKAINAYDKVRTYRHAHWQALALLQIGKCYLQLGNSEKADRALKTLIAEFPSSPYKADAEKLLKSKLSPSSANRGSRTNYR